MDNPMKPFLAWMLGGWLAVCLLGATFYVFDYVQIGPAMPPSAPLSQIHDDPATRFTVAGSTTYSATIRGPSFGAGICGEGYRDTQEAISQYALVWRCDAYLFERYNPLTGGPDWMAALNKRGLLLGALSSDPIPYPRYRLDVRGDAIVRGYVRVEKGVSGDTSIVFFSGADDNPVFALGVSPASGGMTDCLTITAYTPGMGWRQLAGAQWCR